MDTHFPVAPTALLRARLIAMMREQDLDLPPTRSEVEAVIAPPAALFTPPSPSLACPPSPLSDRHE